MSSPGSVHQTNVYNALQAHERRLSDLENNDGSFPWIYVGTYPGDPNTTPDSPPFENGWANIGANGVRFKRVLNWLFLEGGDGIGGGAPATVVFTLPADYIPVRTYPGLLDGLADGSGMFSYTVANDGTVTYINQGAF